MTVNRAIITGYFNDGTVIWLLNTGNKSTKYIYNNFDYATFLKKNGTLEKYKKELKAGGTGFKTFSYFKKLVSADSDVTFSKENLSAVEKTLTAIDKNFVPYEYTPEPF
jgi:hypothetical protein